MVSKAQWQAARSIIAEATNSQETNNIENILGALEAIVSTRHLIVYQWSPENSCQVLADDVARFSIKRERSQRFHVSSVCHPEAHQIQKDMSKYKTGDLLEEMGSRNTVDPCWVLNRPPYLIAMCREPLPSVQKTSMTMLLLHCPDGPIALDLCELLRCMLPAMSALLRKHISASTKTFRSPITVDLTSKEAQVLGLLVRGISTPRMAQSLEIARRTLQFHLKNIYRKMNVSNRHEAIVRALELEDDRETDK